MQRYPLYHTALLFVLLPLLVIGCKGETTTPELEIIEVRVSPEEVQAGYISELVCVFSDSLSDGYEFRWEISGASGERLDTTTSANTLFVKSSSEVGVYNNSVQVFREEEEITPRFDFTLTVVERNWKPEDPFYEGADLLYSTDDGLYLMDSGTKEVRKLSEGGPGVWSPEGDRIVFAQQRPMYNNFNIYTMYTDGSEKKAVSFDKSGNNFIESTRENYAPIWSPDGKKIAYTSCYSCEAGHSREDIILVSTVGDYTQKIITNNEFANKSIGWFNDGEKLLISSEVNSEGQRGNFNDMYTITTDGLSKELLIKNTESNPRCDPALSPDSEFIAYTCGEDNELYIENLESGVINQLTDNDKWERSPSWLPDGSGLVFLMGDGVIPIWGHIYKISIDGTNLEKLTESVGKYYGPEWRPNRN